MDFLYPVVVSAIAIGSVSLGGFLIIISKGIRNGS